MPQLYTPFLEKAGRTIGNAYLQGQQRNEDRQAKQLFGSAYMGDQQAMQQLAMTRPDLAMQVEQVTRQRDQDALSKSATEKTQMLDLQKLAQSTEKEALKFGTVEEANAYLADKKEEFRPIYGDVVDQFTDYTPEEFASSKAAFEPGEQVGALDQARIDKINADIAQMGGADTKEVLAIQKLMLDIQKKKQDIAAGPKKTADETKTAGFHSRMIASQGEIDRILQESPNFEAASFGETGPAALGNIFASTEYQQYKQAADDWIRAKLRRESGAVIAVEEMESEYSNYFPVFGDSEKVIEQKKRARKTAEKAMQGSKPAAAEGPQAVTTQKEYDALPSGATYTEDGTEYRKP